MALVLAIALLTQVLLSNPQAYTVDGPDGLALAMTNGTYGIELGYGCDGIEAGRNVAWLAGSHNVGAIVPLDNPAQVCNIYIDSIVNSDPCAQIDGACDVTALPIPAPSQEDQ